jgi:hypothetical protein
MPLPVTRLERQILALIALVVVIGVIAYAL